jgi:hypothetical protein
MLTDSTVLLISVTEQVGPKSVLCETDVGSWNADRPQLVYVSPLPPHVSIKWMPEHHFTSADCLCLAVPYSSLFTNCTAYCIMVQLALLPHPSNKPYVSDWKVGTRWHSGWGTALQTGRSQVQFPMVTLDFFIDIILPAALWPWGRLSL